MHVRVRSVLYGISLAVLALFVAACAGQGSRPTVTITRSSSTPMPAANFTLPDQQGRTFRLSDQRGKVVLLFFGYITCPDVCPTTLAEWRQVHARLGEDAERVRFVYITVDPERDTPTRLQDYLSRFNTDFIGLTGTSGELEPVYEAYGIYHKKVEVKGSALGYLVEHSASVRVVDPRGLQRTPISFGTTPDDVVANIRQLLKEPTSYM